MIKICFDKEINIRFGGPSGYLYNLKTGLENKNQKLIEFTPNKINENNIKINTIKKKLRSIANIVPIFYEMHLLNNYKRYINSPFDLDEKDKIIHVHTPLDLMRIKKMNKDIYTIFTSHSPEASHLEVIAKLKSESKYDYPRLEKYLEEIDLNAFKKTDCVIFPSKESMEPYFDTLTVLVR